MSSSPILQGSGFSGGDDLSRQDITTPTAPVTASRAHAVSQEEMSACSGEESIRQREEGSTKGAGRGDGKHSSDEERNLPERQSDNNRKRNRSLEDDDLEQHSEKQRTRRNCVGSTSSSETGDNPSGAASELASNLSRLASRQSASATELLQIPPDSRNRARNAPGVLQALATLGQSVGLQAKVVGLMEEVVTRTVHSRVGFGFKKFDSFHCRNVSSVFRTSLKCFAICFLFK